jgi:hypothetical protein
MQLPRLRLREFLLLTTLVSLIVAAVAIRARTASLLSAPDRLVRPDYEPYAKWWQQNAKRKSKLTPRFRSVVTEPDMRER